MKRISNFPTKPPVSKPKLGPSGTCSFSFLVDTKNDMRQKYQFLWLDSVVVAFLTSRKVHKITFHGWNKMDAGSGASAGG